MDNGAIIELYWRRDEAAITQTQMKYERYLTKIAYNVLADLEDSGEAVNDTYLRAWQSIPPNRPTALSAYLGKIARTLSIDIFRRRTSKKRGGSQYAMSLSELSEGLGGTDSVGEAIAIQDLADAISSYLHSQPKRNRDAFVCRYFFTDSVKEIADALGFSEGRVKSLLFRMRGGLREHLKKEGFDL